MKRDLLKSHGHWAERDRAARLHWRPSLTHSGSGVAYGSTRSGSQAAREALGRPTRRFLSGVARALAHDGARVAMTWRGRQRASGGRTLRRSSPRVPRVYGASAQQQEMGGRALKRRGDGGGGSH
jgi:hypothetical protein